MTPNLAQTFYLLLTDGAENLGRDYKSSFANRGSPKRPRFARFTKLRLFKGHRP